MVTKSQLKLVSFIDEGVDRSTLLFDTGITTQHSDCIVSDYTMLAE